MLRKLLICAALVAGSAGANAGAFLLDEGFDAVVNPGWSLPDWYVANLTNPAASATSWFEGNTGNFDAAAGDAGSYLASNVFTAGSAASVDSWLITPMVHVESGVADLSFSTRTQGDWPGDYMEVLVNTTGAPLTSINLGEWASLGVIGADSFPTDWASFAFHYNSNETDIRFAFRYLVDDAQNFGSYIGVDSVRITSVPEPGTLALLALGMLLAPLVLRRRRARI